VVDREFRHVFRPIFGLEYVFYSRLDNNRELCKCNIVVERAMTGFYNKWRPHSRIRYWSWT
jgi:hypothetical protein